MMISLLMGQGAAEVEAQLMAQITQDMIPRERLVLSRAASGAQTKIFGCIKVISQNHR